VELETKRRQHVRRCVACGLPLPVSARADTKTCSDACRKNVSRSL
jgi:predicted nucleic acid-binding Zn ribbon protein